MYLQTVKIIISYEGGERVNHAILMSSGAENIDFMIHGIVQYEIFGHKVWITTSHVCILIVMLLMMALAIAGNRAIKHAKEIPGGFQNVIEMCIRDSGTECEYFRKTKPDRSGTCGVRSGW